MSLDEFFSAMPPMLLGRVSVDDTLQRLGPSRSGAESVDYYRELVSRNWQKYMREIFPVVYQLVLRDDYSLWQGLVADYFEAHEPRTRHANELGADFSEYLQKRRNEGLPISPVLEEVADYQMCEIRCAHCPDDVGDGFEQRLFVRQYTHPVRDVILALRKDPKSPVLEPKDTTVVMYRDLETFEVRQLSPTPFGLVAIARRQGLPVPEPLVGHIEAIDQAEQELVQMHILTPSSSRP